MATNTKLPPPPSAHHVITARGSVGGNRKKQKRRAKQAAKGTAPPLQAPGQPDGLDYDEDPLGYGDEDEYDYSDGDAYPDYVPPSHPAPNGYNIPPPAMAPIPSNNKKKKSGGAHDHHVHSPYNPELMGNHMPPLPHPPPSGEMQKVGGKNIWNTSTQQERQNIKDFWLSLSEEERKSLLKIEKDAVLRKMKQQQKHSCSCTVCGRKRTAIEEELEVLYEGYYDELEQYANSGHPALPATDGMMPDPLQHRPHPFAAISPPPPSHSRHRTSQLQEHFDDEDLSEDYAEESSEFISDDDAFEDSDVSPDPLARNAMPPVPDFIGFGENLTVKGNYAYWKERLKKALIPGSDNLLTVADDLLKNDGRKFIEMMEQLAERRMARESQAEYEAANPSSHHGSYPGDPGYKHHHDDPLAAGDEFDDDEASYDSQEEYDDDLEDDDEMGGLTEEQRVAEGRRMFQIFAARMFEQRVLTAYKEKVARERQQKLLEELEDETRAEAQRDAKKQRDAEKKKAKKKQQQQAKAEEKAKKDAEKAAEEAKIKEAEEKKLEEQRLKKEEQRRKKEEGKRKLDEERAKKEAERLRKAQEEQQRREDAERKAREQKAAEKTKKEEARKREREEREAREQEARDRKAQEEKEKKEREAKAKAEREAKEREKAAQQAAQPPSQPQVTKRPSQAGMVAVPPVLQKQTSSGISSPYPTIATPAIPKAPTPARQRQPSQQGSHASSPRQTQSQISSAPSKSSSPGTNAPPAQRDVQQQQQPPVGPPKTIMQKPGNQQPLQPQNQQGVQTSPLPQQQPIQPPPGMPHPPHHQTSGGFSPMPGMGYGQFPGGPQQGPIMPQRGHHMPMYPPHHGGPQMGMQTNRFGLPMMSGLNGMAQSPPGMPYSQQQQQQQQTRGMEFPFEQSPGQQPPPGFGPPQQQHQPFQQQPPQQRQQPNHTPPIGHQPAIPPAATSRQPSAGTHSRQQSASDKDRFEPSSAAASAPIARPAPIQRPSSVKPGSNAIADVDDLSKHLGSSALLDEGDEPMPTNTGVEARRTSTLPTRAPQAPIGGLGSAFGAPNAGGFGASGWNHPAQALSGFGQPSSLGQQQGWGSMAPAANQGMNTWSSNNTAFAANGAFGSLGPVGGTSALQRPVGTTIGGSINRPLTVRLALCTACRQLSSTSPIPASDGFHPVDVLLRQIAASRAVPDPQPSLAEIEDICETEGDAQNGGGELQVRHESAGGASPFSVKWFPGPATPEVGGRGAIGGGGVGEIGSPVPVKASPGHVNSGGFAGLGNMWNSSTSSSAAAQGRGGFP